MSIYDYVQCIRVFPGFMEKTEKEQVLANQIFKQKSDGKLADNILKPQNVQADYIILKGSSFLLNNMKYYIPKQIPSPSVPEVED